MVCDERKICCWPMTIPMERAALRGETAGDASRSRADARTDARAVGRWLVAFAAMIVAIILVGGATRLTESGLSITEWKPVSGVIPPMSEAAWQAEFAKYQRIPQYQQLNQGMSLESFKRIYLWEYGHRPFPAPARGIANAVWANPSLEAHHFDPRSDEDWGEVADLYARAYVEHHWYYPMSAAELRLIAAGRVEPAISYIVRLDGAPVAMAIAIVNETQSSLRVAGMVPPEPVQRVWRTTQRARTWRQWLFAVVPEYRGRTIGGLGTALYVRVRDAAEIAGYERGEAAWTALVAERLRDGLGVLGAHQYKTFRVYQRDL